MDLKVPAEAEIIPFNSFWDSTELERKVDELTGVVFQFLLGFYPSC